MQAVDRELEQVLRHCDVLQLVATEIPQPDTIRKATTSQVRGHGGHHYLPSVGGSGDSGGSVHVHPHIVTVMHLRGPCVDTDAHPHELTAWPRIIFQLPLGLSSCLDRPLGSGEHHEEAVPFSAQFRAPVHRPGLAKYLPLDVQRGCVAGPESIQQQGGALDVGEQQRHRPCRQLAHRLITPRRRSATVGGSSGRP